VGDPPSIVCQGHFCSGHSRRTGRALDVAVQITFVYVQRKTAPRAQIVVLSVFSQLPTFGNVFQSVFAAIKVGPSRRPYVRPPLFRWFRALCAQTLCLMILIILLRAHHSPPWGHSGSQTHTLAALLTLVLVLVVPPTKIWRSPHPVFRHAPFSLNYRPPS